jgi:hypothetical protein
MIGGVYSLRNVFSRNKYSFTLPYEFKKLFDSYCDIEGIDLDIFMEEIFLEFNRMRPYRFSKEKRRYLPKKVNLISEVNCTLANHNIIFDFIAKCRKNGFSEKNVLITLAMNKIYNTKLRKEVVKVCNIVSSHLAFKSNKLDESKYINLHIERKYYDLLIKRSKKFEIHRHDLLNDIIIENFIDEFYKNGNIHIPCWYKHRLEKGEETTKVCLKIYKPIYELCKTIGMVANRSTSNIIRFMITKGVFDIGNVRKGSILNG